MRVRILVYTIISILFLFLVDGYLSVIKIPFTNKYLSCRLPYGNIRTGLLRQDGVECCPGLVRAMGSMSADKCYFSWDKHIPQLISIEDSIKNEK